MRKYCTTRTDTQVADCFKDKKPEDLANIRLRNREENWSLVLYQADEKWVDSGTMACGAVVFVPKSKQNILTFDLFYDPDDIIKFWESHKDGFHAVDVDSGMFPKLHEASKILDLNGQPNVDAEHPSAWSETYAASLFYDRGWASIDEINDAIFHAHWMRIYLDVVDEGEAVWCMPEPGDVEINSKFITLPPD